ncbi:hypothetical protein SCLCIDRAFT_18504 [Scleroderma citrinum Foug A]|uniref:Palmitoyltransferase n=1 Tax=Scleroderma citrinum Foug A TaxID=1036808 RepID=A0A0C3D3V6_9AGAM|nr:hypothetical protein SCLCIDRAFT_18504 [Scleroderma citrinum Foug A]
MAYVVAIISSDHSDATVPQPSVLVLNHYLRTLHAPITFLVHLCISYTLTFLSFSSRSSSVARDPGPCWAPKLERTHHCCSLSGRRVLKMDHHCPWLGSRCVGHRTSPSFFHFIASITLLSTHVAIFAGSAFWRSFNNPRLTLDEATPLHELFLLAVGTAFGTVMGSFTISHVTNQTTVESLSPFLLLRYLLPLPLTPPLLVYPLLEHELSYNQQRLVRKAHSTVKLYDLGCKKTGAGMHMLSKLADALATVHKDA